MKQVVTRDLSPLNKHYIVCEKDQQYFVHKFDKFKLLWFLASNIINAMLNYQHNYCSPDILKCCYFALQNEMCDILHHNINVDQVQENRKTW